MGFDLDLDVLPSATDVWAIEEKVWQHWGYKIPLVDVEKLQDVWRLKQHEEICVPFMYKYVYIYMHMYL
jgi:hypothetical protein